MTLSWFAAAVNRMWATCGPLLLEQALPLDARRRLCLVRCDDRKVLLLIGGSQDIVVGWLDATAPGGQAEP